MDGKVTYRDVAQRCEALIKQTDELRTWIKNKL